jgi:hypothetical protein
VTTHDDRLWSYLAREHAEQLAATEHLTPPVRRTRFQRFTGPTRFVTAAGLSIAATIAVVLVIVAVNGPQPAYAVSQNSDGTVTITLTEIAGVDGLNQRLAEAGIRAKALLTHPTCWGSVYQVAFGQLYPQIVTKNGPAPAVTIQPDAIPADNTLVLVTQRMPRRNGRAPAIGVLLMLVRSPAPDCIGQVRRAASPPRPGIALPPGWPQSVR